MLLVASLLPSAFSPTSIPYAALQDDALFTAAGTGAALSDVGILSVSGVPGYAALRRKVLMHAHACGLDSPATAEHTFNDGTRRRTLATHTIPGPGGAQPIEHKSPSAHCTKLSSEAAKFRQVVHEVIGLFGARLSTLVTPKLRGAAPLLATPDGLDFSTFADVVDSGEHLEHFHSYSKAEASVEQTIEMHTDQGLFIAFTPALLLNAEGVPTKDEAADFFVQLPDGSSAKASFEQDSIVLVLGDGVEAIVNARAASPLLRAAPHALQMRATFPGASRVWYGRMVLPPSDAISDAHGKTYQLVREETIAASRAGDDEAEVLGLACSAADARAHQRELNVCAEGTLYCWHRCMSISQYVNVSHCDALGGGYSAQCTNDRDQLYTSNGHGSYFPSCTNSTEGETNLREDPRTKLSAFPTDAATCSSAAFSSFTNTTGFDFSWTENEPAAATGWGRRLAPVAPGEALFTIAWKVQSDNTVRIKLFFNGLFGWLSVGFRNDLDRIHNGMNGANVVLGAPGQWIPETRSLGGSRIVHGLDYNTSLLNVQEYLIAQTSFKDWGGPVAGQNLQNVAVEAGDCFTSIEFTASDFNNQAFNLDGTDTLIWAANGEDKFMGYHGRSNRGIFDITWKSGGSTFVDYPPPPAPKPPPPMPPVNPPVAPQLGAMGTTNLSPPTAPDGTDALSIGAIVGIIAGSVVGLLGIGALVATLVLKQSATTGEKNGVVKVVKTDETSTTASAEDKL